MQAQFLSLNHNTMFIMSYQEKNIPVLPEATDAFGWLNWRLYNRYCEKGEAGLMENLGFPPMYFYKKYKISFPRRHADFEYFSPVSPENLIDLKVEIMRVGTTSITLSYHFYKKSRQQRKQILAGKAEVTIVAYDHRVLQKTELPVELVESIKRVRPEAFSN